MSTALSKGYTSSNKNYCGKKSLKQAKLPSSCSETLWKRPLWGITPLCWLWAVQQHESPASCTQHHPCSPFHLLRLVGNYFFVLLLLRYAESRVLLCLFRISHNVLFLLWKYHPKSLSCLSKQRTSIYRGLDLSVQAQFSAIYWSTGKQGSESPNAKLPFHPIPEVSCRFPYTIVRNAEWLFPLVSFWIPVDIDVTTRAK